MKILSVFIFIFLLSTSTYAENLPKGCISNIRSVYGKRVGLAVGSSLLTAGTVGATVAFPFLGAVAVAPLAAAIILAREAHKYRKTHAILNTIQSDNVGRTDWTFKKFAKKLGMKPEELLAISKQNPQFFCKGNDFFLYDQILGKLKSLKVSPIIKQILTECSPQKMPSQFKSNFFKGAIGQNHKDKALGSEQFLGVKLRGRENRVNWIYHPENNFTDPTQHTIDKYQYFIHMIRATHPVGTHAFAFNNSGKYLNGLKKTSLSLANQSDTIPFWDGMGLLVQAKPESIIATNSQNMGSDGIKLKNLNKSFQIGTPKTVFKGRTKTSRNNEVVSVHGSKAIGYLLLADDRTNKPIFEVYEPDKAQALLTACKKWKLPVVLLKRTNSKDSY